MGAICQEEKVLIPEDIFNLYKHLEGRAYRKAVFKHYRGIDESHLYPILGEFNVTERAIRRLYYYERDSGEYVDGLELCYFLDTKISELTNAEF